MAATRVKAHRRRRGLVFGVMAGEVFIWFVVVADVSVMVRVTAVRRYGI
jgi:hypothetical protein